MGPLAADERRVLIVWFPTFDCLACGFRRRRVLNPASESAEKRGRRRALHECASRHGKSRAMSDNNETRHPPTLGPEVMAAIGRELRAMYADIIAEGVPERFAEILRRLDEPSSKDSKNDPTPPTI